MSATSNFRNDKADLPIGSLKTIMSGNANTGVTPMTFATDNGLWIPANNIYSQTTYPELYSQLGLINAGVFTQKTTSLSDAVTDFTYGNTLYVASGNNAIGTSTDINNWSIQGVNTLSVIRSIVYGNGVFMLTAEGGVLKRSTDGINWTNLNSTTTSIIYVTYGNGVFVMYGDGGSTTPFKTSTDNGTTWTDRNPRLSTCYGVYYGNGIFVARADSRTGNALSYSADSGVTWTGKNLIGLGNTGAFISGVYGNGIYLIAGSGNYIYTSNDAINWSASANSYGYVQAMSYGNGYYIIRNTGGQSYYSANAITWNTGPGIFESSLKFISQSNLHYSFSSTTIKTSANGVTWTTANTNLPSFSSSLQIRDIEYFPNINSYVYAFEKYLGTSTDSINWSLYYTSKKLIYNAGLFVTAGDGGKIYTSSDANTWTDRTSGTYHNINALAYGNGLYVYGGVNGVLATSTDAITWTTRTSGTTSIINALTYGNSTYVYGGAGGVLSSSSNGVTWTARTSGTTSQINALTYGNGLYIYAGVGGVLATSTDAITWTTRTSGTTSTIVTLTYASGVYYYGISTIGLTGLVGSSTDGITWKNLAAGTSNIYSLVYANSLYIAGGIGFVGSASNAQTINYSSGYDVTTNFFVPSLTNQGTFGTVTIGSQPTQTTYVKAKM